MNNSTSKIVKDRLQYKHVSSVKKRILLGCTSGASLLAFAGIGIGIGYAIWKTNVKSTKVSFYGHQVGIFQVGVDPTTNSYIQLISDDGFDLSNKFFKIVGGVPGDMTPVTMMTNTDGKIFFHTPQGTPGIGNPCFIIDGTEKHVDISVTPAAIPTPPGPSFTAVLRGAYDIRYNEVIDYDKVWINLWYQNFNFSPYDTHNYSAIFNNTGTNTYDGITFYGQSNDNVSTGSVILRLDGTPINPSANCNLTITDEMLNINTTLNFEVYL